jgi:hypothetical protein
MSEKEPFRAIYYGKSAKKPPTEAYIILGSTDGNNLTFECRFFSNQSKTLAETAV